MSILLPVDQLVGLRAVGQPAGLSGVPTLHVLIMKQCPVYYAYVCTKIGQTQLTNTTKSGRTNVKVNYIL